MTVPYTIIIPHKPTPINNKALALNIQMLADNSRLPFELIIDTTVPADPYKLWNYYSVRVDSETVVFSNSDVLMGPGWDWWMVGACQDNSIVTGYLVEPGNIGVADQNIYADFGKTPDTFRRQEFEDWVKRQTKPEIIEQRGWYMPCAMRTDWFTTVSGKFNTDKPFPNPNDIDFWEHCIKDYGTKLLRANSFAYHFQNLSNR